MKVVELLCLFDGCEWNEHTVTDNKLYPYRAFCDMLHNEYMKCRPKNKSLLNLEKQKGQFTHLENRVNELHKDNELLRQETKEHLNTIYKLEHNLKELKDKHLKQTSEGEKLESKLTDTAKQLEEYKQRAKSTHNIEEMQNLRKDLEALTKTKEDL